DHTDRSRHLRNGALARRVEQALGLELVLQRQKGRMQVATPCPAHALDLQLVIAPRLVERDIDTKLELLTRLGHKPDRLSPATKHYCLDRRAFVLDGEIPVSGGRLCEVGDFAAHPDPRKTALQQLSHT